MIWSCWNEAIEELNGCADYYFDCAWNYFGTHNSLYIFVVVCMTHFGCCIKCRVYTLGYVPSIFECYCGDFWCVQHVVHGPVMHSILLKEPWNVTSNLNHVFLDNIRWSKFFNKYPKPQVRVIFMFSISTLIELGRVWACGIGITSFTLPLIYWKDFFCE